MAKTAATHTGAGAVDITYVPAVATTGTNTYNYTGAVETVVITTSGYYDIAADGAQGGSGDGSAGGAGAMASGEVYLQAGAISRSSSAARAAGRGPAAVAAAAAAS